MDSRTRGILTVVGIAAIAAAGVAAGVALQHESAPRRLLRRGSRYVDRDTLTGLLDKVLDTLPRRDSERLMHRIHSKLKEWQP